MKEVPLHEAKNGLSALIADVESTGRSVTITRHGKPVARLSPIAAANDGDARVAVARLLIDRLVEDSIMGDEPDWRTLKAEMDDTRP